MIEFNVESVVDKPVVLWVDTGEEDENLEALDPIAFRIWLECPLKVDRFSDGRISISSPGTEFSLVLSPDIARELAVDIASAMHHKQVDLKIPEDMPEDDEWTG